MYPDFPDLTKCKKCDTQFWLSKSESIETYEWITYTDPNIQHAQEADFLSIDDYLIALRDGLVSSKAEELKVRQRIWWTYNDRARNGDDLFLSKNDENTWKSNAKALINLLDEAITNQSIMLAELYRNLGEFDRCIEIMKKVDDENLEFVKTRLITECARKNKALVRLA
tara:strand:- start:10427 stop:10933 length:507 start_codon:yes stop_codon:yes gene_type:complete